MPKTAAAPYLFATKAKNKAVAIVETAAAKPTTPKLVDPIHCSFNPLEEFSDLNHLPLQAFVELTRRILTTIYPRRAAC